MSEAPPTVAIVGASSNRSKFGNKSVRAHAAEGWTVYAVNPRGGTIEGLESFHDLSGIDGPLDRICIYLPPAVTLPLLPELVAFPDAEVWFNPGSANDEVIKMAKRMKLTFVEGCSIVDVGRSPSEFP